MLKGRLSSKDDESTAPEEEEKLIIMTPVPILNRYRGWAGRDALPEESVANDVSEYYWKEVHDEEEEGEEGEDKFVYPPELRLKTVMIKISEAPKRPRQDRPMTNAEQNRAKRRLKSAAVVVSRQEEEEEERPEEEVPRVRRRGAVVVPGAAE